jgi:hypothetical protein
VLEKAKPDGWWTLQAEVKISMTQKKVLEVVLQIKGAQNANLCFMDAHTF